MRLLERIGLTGCETDMGFYLLQAIPKGLPEMGIGFLNYK
ncbi:hypothetical protein CLOSTMETH_00649 [[Clostridium] methylpentosum DSM 5476]|uniref:Uncharacterized protein n=1 Tax=[Clostridium] methylpentosum DSM 5476 TaxID=537013 RepID=C0E9Z5_9FIRM|nr:hypothetical protein CLOSTMETH_00649 [[Clostridium] methylpentosum DSM 5476]